MIELRSEAPEYEVGHTSPEIVAPAHGRSWPMAAGPPHLLFTVSLENNRTWRGHKENDVGSGRASQEVLIDLLACGLASMYPAYDDPLCPQPDTLE